MFQIIDSTLREGEQYHQANFSTDDKVKIAQGLDRFGVEYIEVTNPAASAKHQRDCTILCSLGLPRSKIVGHIRCNLEDAMTAVKAGLKRVNVMIGTSSYMQKFSHGKTLEEITSAALTVVSYLRSKDIEVRFSGEDAFRTDLTKLINLYKRMESYGVARVGIPDTVGCAGPDDVMRVVSAIREAVSVDIETHFHNDTGCAVANAYMAVKAGATHIDTSVLGVGERNGITPLGGFIARMAALDRGLIREKYDLKALAPLEKLVASCCRLAIPFNNCITGSAAFCHKAGIHTKAILADPSTYEILRPEDFGVERSIDIASPLTGWNAISNRAQTLGIDISKDDCKRVTKLIKESANAGTIGKNDVDDMLRCMGTPATACP